MGSVRLEEHLVISISQSGIKEDVLERFTEWQAQ